MRHLSATLAALALAAALVDGCGSSSNSPMGGDGGDDATPGNPSGNDGASPGDVGAGDTGPGTAVDGGSDSTMDDGAAGNVDASDAAIADASDAAVADASDSAVGDASDASLTDASDAATSETDASDSSSTTPDSGPDATAADASTDSGPASTVLLVGTSPLQLLQANLTGGTWSTATVAGGSAYAPSITVDTAGNGVAVFTSATGAVVDSTIWSAGAWSSPASVNAGAVSRGQPFVDATGSSTANLVYQDGSYKYWYLAYAAGSWSASPQAVGPAGGQLYGPAPATIAALGASATAAFFDGLAPDYNYLAESDLSGGSWQARTDILGPEAYGTPAAIISLSAGPELMIVYAQPTTNQIAFVTRTAGAWSAQTQIASAFSSAMVALAPLPGGGAILAFEGTDTKLYWSQYSGGSWSTVAPFASSNVSVDTSPAVTHGIAGDTAELAYVSGGVAYYAPLVGATWGTPVMVGGTGLNGVAIGATP